jgi:ABC-type transport system involved in multi-copper enzyme maturation permease subunit
MLWYKAWLETRWRFLIGLALVTCSAAGTVLAYPKVLQLMPLASTVDSGGELGRRIREAVDLSRDYRGYVWSQWFRQNLPQAVTLFAALLGAGGLLAQASGGGALFTLSLPASRNRVLGVRAATGLAELLVLVLVPSLAVPLLSPAIAQHYAVGDALVYGVCQFAGGAVFFSLAFLLSTMFNDVWRPLLVACAAAMTLAIGAQFVPELSRVSVFSVMTAESYFRSGALPWLGLLVSAGVSAAMLFTAAKNIEQTDF